MIEVVRGENIELCTYGALDGRTFLFKLFFGLVCVLRALEHYFLVFV